MKIKLLPLFVLLLLLIALVSKDTQTRQVTAQGNSQTTLVEDFANGRNPPILNSAHFNHQFSLGTAWDLTGSTIGEPLSQSPPYALTLYAGNEDRVTFNQPSNIAYISAAQVWGWTLPAANDLPAGRGRVVQPLPARDLDAARRSGPRGRPRCCTGRGVAVARPGCAPPRAASPRRRSPHRADARARRTARPRGTRRGTRRCRT